MPSARCPVCGGELANGFCPRCLVKLGLEGAGPARGEAGATLDLPARPASVLETIGATIGAVPRMMLRDTAFDEGPSPIILPGNGHDTSTRYRIDGEIARGGMGTILKGRDSDLGREVAIKVLREDQRGNTDMVCRFVEEAQIGGQLQHPGIVPIYEMGTFADRRPFFSMKLVKGKTLAQLLADRLTPADDRPRFLSIFQAIAQTMAYAHMRGVIHRDLKPSNVMVGSFGEVQVMDWGLAKVMAGGLADDARPGEDRPPGTPTAPARVGSNADLSLAGSVMGTPGYMPPEQARGELDRIDERADVFALGSILGEVLTGSPAFTGRTSKEILRNTARGDSPEALGRLDGSGAEPELISLARDCLAAKPEGRPRNANVVAGRITAYLSGVQERVQAAEREQAVAVARAIEERRRRRVLLALAASVLAFTILGGLSTASHLQRRAAREAAGQRVVDRVNMLQKQALDQPEEVLRWQLALAAVEQADPVDDPTTRDQLLGLHREIRAGFDAARRDKTLLDRLVDIRSAEVDDPDGSGTEAAYADAFREAGIDFARLPPAEAGARIKARPSSVATALAMALDDWAAIRRRGRAKPSGAERLGEAARVADPDPWRIALRITLDQADRAARRAGLQALAERADFEEQGAISLQLLGTALHAAGDAPLAESVLRAAQRRHPRDVWVNYALATVMETLSRRDEAIRFYTAARAIRPETAHELAHVLASRGDSDEAIAVFRDLSNLRPGNARHLVCLGKAIKAKGLSREAGEVLEAAVVASREAVRLEPKLATAHSNLGNALYFQGKLEEAVAEYREAVRLEPKLATAHSNLGNALYFQGKLEEVIAHCREAIRLEPDLATAHANLRNALYDLGRLAEAVDEDREVLRLKPDYAEAHINLGNSLKALGRFDEAAAKYREAIRLRPDLAKARYNLGNALNAQGKRDEAAVEYREAIRLEPDDAEAHSNLGLVLRAQGDYAGSLAMYRRAHELGSKQPDWRYPSAQLVAQAKRMAALAERLPTLLKGDERPTDNAERLALAQLCYDTKRHAAAARFWAEALETDPKLGDDRRAGHRYNAACAASLAAAGQGKNDPSPDEAARAKLREQAMGWLKAELAAWTKLLESGPPQARPVIAQTLNHWKVDTDLAGIRDADALAKVPEVERKNWQALWAEVDALLGDGKTK